MKWKWANVIGVTVVVLVVLIVILQNTETVETKLLFVSVSMPRVVLLAVALLVGFWLGVIASSRIRKSREQPS